MRARRLLAKEVWEISDIEQSASTAAGIVLSTGLLTDEEADFVHDRIMPEERRHARNMTAWARELGQGARPRRLGAHSALTFKDMLLISTLEPRRKLAYILATMVWNESFTLKWSPRTIRLYKRIEPAFGAQYEANMAEEAGHVEWGAGVLDRLRREDPVTARQAEVYTRYLDSVGPAVVSRAHMAVYRKLEDALEAAPADS